MRADESAPPPRRVLLHLICEGDHGLLPAPERAAWMGEGGYPAEARAATAEGWMVGPQIFCPECRASRKRKEPDDGDEEA